MYSSIPIFLLLNFNSQQEAMKGYQEVFSALLRLRRSALLLDELWQDIVQAPGVQRRIAFEALLKYGPCPTKGLDNLCVSALSNVFAGRGHTFLFAQSHRYKIQP